MKFTLSFVAALVLQASAATSTDARIDRLEPRTCGDPAKAIPLYRVFNAVNTDHLYTTSASEIIRFVNGGLYIQEKVAGKVFATQEFGTIPLYRLYSAQSVDHFYTTSASERDRAISQLSYASEGIAGYVYPDTACGALAFYCLLRPAPFSDHFYTMSKSEADFAQTIG
ncbi:hypothetical protein H0H81_006456 [Sphagnurus paluster]|uniref:DUF5648 domain-containing protein n=1 Tax=Sphagnurus paluster TaxID=117069 RepID=A0A9P7GK18_9AGAR|nr:hypothetical protein H0H81_006456 [Sphagnurus paluster]